MKRGIHDYKPATLLCNTGYPGAKILFRFFPCSPNAVRHPFVHPSTYPPPRVECRPIAAAGDGGISFRRFRRKNQSRSTSPSGENRRKSPSGENRRKSPKADLDASACHDCCRGHCWQGSGRCGAGHPCTARRWGADRSLSRVSGLIGGDVCKILRTWSPIRTNSSDMRTNTGRGRVWLKRPMVQVVRIDKIVRRPIWRISTIFGISTIGTIGTNYRPGLGELWPFWELWQLGPMALITHQHETPRAKRRDTLRVALQRWMRAVE